MKPIKITVKDGMGRGPNGVHLPAYDQQGNVLGDGEWEAVEVWQLKLGNYGNFKNVPDEDYKKWVNSYSDFKENYDTMSDVYVQTRRIYQSTEVKQEVPTSALARHIAKAITASDELLRQANPLSNDTVQGETVELSSIEKLFENRLAKLEKSRISGISTGFDHNYVLLKSECEYMLSEIKSLTKKKE